MTLPVLDEIEQRVVGALLEKQVTVPGSYPLTANALRTACNQTSSREPVTDYDERTLQEAALGLKKRELVRIVWSDTGRRTLKYHQALTDVLELSAPERALVTVLLLRGAQSAGELRTRTDRLHPFADKSAVEAVLRELASRAEPLVAELPRRPGERETRWVHLLGPLAGVETEDVEPAVEVDLDTRDTRVRAAYDAVASAYAEAVADELDDLAFERWLLTRVAWLAGEAPIVEVGTGPGQVAAFLAECGAAVTGMDQSEAMIAEATTRFGEIDDLRFETGDLRSLMRPVAADGWGAVLAWYALVHFALEELPDVIAALVRPMRPGGWFVYAGHCGSGVRHADVWFEQPVDLDFTRAEPAQLVELLRAAGLVDLEWYHRGPIGEETTERLYVLARRPD